VGVAVEPVEGAQTRRVVKYLDELGDALGEVVPVHDIPLLGHVDKAQHLGDPSVGVVHADDSDKVRVPAHAQRLDILHRVRYTRDGDV
jgi:hypothetical protein